MRIAQVTPLWERVPPPAYGGIELVVSLLTDELVRRGHEVTLFATGDSLTLAELESVHPRAIRTDPTVKEYQVYESLQLAQVYERSHEFDIIHSHMGFAALPFAQFATTPTVHTLHGVFTPDNEKLFSYARSQSYVSISDAQRDPRLGLNCVATVYNGIDVDSYKFYAKPNDPPYLAFLGRLSPEKGPDHAISIAKRTGLPLKMAGKIDVVDRQFYEEVLAPQIDGEQIQYLGEANHVEKNTLMGQAMATLFPITWKEPFGLVMVEAMAAGTPVVGMRLGSVPEVVQDGKTGFLCETIDDCVAALDRLAEIDRAMCRQHVIENFSVQRMTDGYEAVYRQLLGETMFPASEQLVGQLN
ncbi:glycosyltransferase family 4 protein [Leptolyngbya sp. FACHB-17]|uniref:glycosyltransferase family 4 protein n=1 Tax=unclassified Leptolyngbya TaxID=2650499 RepID=UPI0016815939|nr:glycosyltransferase family 4 protein [Leptolyngbya sp. FACHB-17]MBD2079987.1 glycosyltransferase family 4 protein [Leptolyngbya sp. FACHB-17]